MMNGRKWTMAAISVCLMTMTACEKGVVDEGQDTHGKADGQEVDFRVNVKSNNAGFESEESTYPFTRITFAVLEDGSFVDQTTQKKGDADFADLKMKLTPGKYNAVLLAHSGNSAVGFESNVTKVVMPDRVVTDCFWCNQSFTVSENTTNVQLDLSRIVAMFRLIIADSMPSNVASMKFYYTGGSSTLNALTGQGSANSRQTVNIPVTADMIGKSNTFEVYTIPRPGSESLNMTVTALDASGSEIKKIEWKEVPIAVNQITTYKGKFFSDSGSGGDTGGDTGDDDDDKEGEVSFDITIDTSWNNQISEGY